MATAFYTDTAKGHPARSGTGPIVVPFKYAVEAAFMDAQDEYLVLVKLPRYSTLLAYWIDMPDCGTSGAADLGTRTDQDRFAAAKTIVTAAVWTNLDSSDSDLDSYYIKESLPYRVLDTDAGDDTDEDDLRLTCTTALSAQATTKSIRGWAMFVCNEVQASAEVRDS
jgi:hypothetical protein